MKQIFALISAMLLAVMLSVPAAALSASDIVSEAAVLIDADTGQVLYDKGMSRRMFPASTTKVMTALLVCESRRPDELVTVSESAVEIDEWNSSHIALQPGEQATVEDLLYALLLPSANDAANALAEHVAGSQEAFAAMMTERARQLGATGTHFTNAHGLHDPGHYTTPHDMALITAFALRNSMFLNYFGTALHTMPPTNLQADERYFTNQQYMLVEDTQYYDPDVLGGKVGYTSEAKHTMITAARRNGRTLICVVMRSTNRWEKFQDTRALLDYGFEQFRTITLPAEKFTTGTVPVGDASATFYSDGDFTALLRNDISESRVRVNYHLPESFASGDSLPDSVEVVIDTSERTLPTVLGRQPIRNDLPAESIAAPEVATAFITDTPAKTNPFGDSLPWAAPVAIAFLLALTICFFVLSHYRLQKRRRKRLEQLRRMRGEKHPRKSA